MSKPAAAAAVLVALATSTAGVIDARPAGAEQTARVRVPNVVGERLRHAEQLLRRAGLTVGLQTCSCTFGIDEPRSYVCLQRPRAGAVVDRGTAVSTFSARARSDC